MADEINVPYSTGRVLASNNSRHVTENNFDNKYKNNKKRNNKEKKKMIIEHDNDRLLDSGDVNSLMDEDRIISIKI